MKIATWNIGGGFIQGDSGKYDIEDINYFVEELKKIDPDIICLQEVHFNEKENYNQTKIIAHGLKMYYSYTFMHLSHLKDGMSMSVCILSKNLITNVNYHQFINPSLELTSSNGNKQLSNDKGMLIGNTTVNDKQIFIASLHLLPFHYFQQDFEDEKFAHIKKDIEEKINTLKDQNAIICGDYNYADINKALSGIFENGFKEAFTNQVTTPKGKKIDHIVFSKSITMETYGIIQGKADHYLCYMDFNF